MKCKNCGTEFTEGCFCPECGTKYSEHDDDSTKETLFFEKNDTNKLRNESKIETSSKSEELYDETEKEKLQTKSKVKYLAIILAIFILVLIVLVLKGCTHSSTITDTNTDSQNNLSGADELEQEVESASVMTPVETVSNFLDAEVTCDSEKALSYCADDFKTEISEDIKQIKQLKEESNTTFMECAVEEAQFIFFATATDEVIDAEYLRKDNEVQKAVEDFTEFVIAELFIRSISDDVEMKDDGTAIVTVKMSAKDGATGESIESYFDNYLQTFLLNKLSDNSNFLKKQVAKKIVKEAVLDSLNDLKIEYEKIEPVYMGKRIYYLQQDSGKWMIFKKEREDANSSVIDENDNHEEETMVQSMFPEIVDEEAVDEEIAYEEEIVEPEEEFTEPCIRYGRYVFTSTNPAVTYTLQIIPDSAVGKDHIRVNWGYEGHGERCFDGYTEHDDIHMVVYCDYLSQQGYYLDLNATSGKEIDVVAAGYNSEHKNEYEFNCSGHFMYDGE
ncbi:zinc ribbon domain-containing protein [Pseudobutyrivibrio ruminis]|uniref:zinc ribbon domain-containing protein n=1 Tax=Pseudobutyrivibrio ruminis TaxID=46206 RepID=UPI0004186D0D|nr:zinc ribbon domain-containing protein [Pseudobutyrivibrio ruminis]